MNSVMDTAIQYNTDEKYSHTLLFVYGVFCLDYLMIIMQIDYLACSINFLYMYVYIPNSTVLVNWHTSLKRLCVLQHIITG